MIEAYSLYSGSSGNAYLLRSGGTNLLVDAGRSSAALCRALRCTGTEPEDISAVLVTHEHTDHVSALKVFLKKYRTPLIGAVPVLSAICCGDQMTENVRALPPGREFSIGTFSVCGCAVPHDSSANLCYRFRTADGDSIAIATDMGEVTPECAEFLSGTTCAVIEANHDPEMLRCGPYPWHLKSRIASKFGHLSNGRCAELAAELAEAGTAGFVLAHLSRENNTPELALSTVKETLSEVGFGNVPVSCAGEEHTVRIMIKDGVCDISTITSDAREIKRSISDKDKIDLCRCSCGVLLP